MNRFPKKHLCRQCGEQPLTSTWKGWLCRECYDAKLESEKQPDFTAFSEEIRAIGVNPYDFYIRMETIKQLKREGHLA